MVQNEHSHLDRASGHLYKHMVIYEIPLLLVFIAGLIMNLFNRPGGILITISLFILALLYFLLAMAKIPDANTGPFITGLYRLNAWLLSITIIGLLFILRNWPLANIVALSGSVPLLLLVLVMLIVRARNPGHPLIRMITIIRSLAYGLFVLFFYMVSFHLFTN